MKKDFETLYQEMLNEETIKNKWNIYKEKVEKRKKIFLIIGIVLFFALIILPGKIDGNSILTFFYSIILLVIIYVVSLMHSKSGKEYNESFKKIIITKLIENFYEDVSYLYTEGISSSIYNEGKYNEYYNKYYSDDYFRGKIEKMGSIELAEVITEKEEKYRDREGRVRTETTTIFSGLFAKINIDKSIQTELKIRTNWIGINRNKNKLEMDSQLFEKNFDVYTENKIIGMQLLTSDVMELLVEFRNTMKIEYDISIYNNKIYLRFMTGPMFETTISTKRMLDKKDIEKYYKILEFTYNLSEKLIEVIKHTEI